MRFISFTRFIELGGSVGAQALVQVANLVTGLLILQVLPVRDYAIYTISGVLVGVGMVMANMSLYPAVSYFTSRYRNDKRLLNSLIATANSIHIYIIAAMAVALFIFGSSYLNQFNSVDEMIFIVLLCIVQTAIAGRIEQARSIAIGLGNIRATIVSDVIVCTSRTLMIGGIFLTHVLTVKAILLVTIIANVGGLLSVRKLYDSDNAEADPVLRRQILRYMYPLWPENIFFLVQGNVVLMILAWFGSHAVVAEMGALSRLVQITSVLTVLTRVWAFPYVSRFQSVDDLRKRGLLVIGMFMLAGAPFVLLAWIFPQPFLMLLGNQYEHLRPYVLPIMAIGVLNLVGGAAYMICLATGRPGGLSFAIAPVLTVQILYIGLIGITSITTAIGFSAVVASVELAFRLSLFFWLARPSGREPADQR